MKDVPKIHSEEKPLILYYGCLETSYIFIESYFFQ